MYTYRFILYLYHLAVHFQIVVQHCQKNATEAEIMLVIANCLKNAPYRKGGGGQQLKDEKGSAERP